MEFNETWQEQDLTVFYQVCVFRANQIKHSFYNILAIFKRTGP